MKEVLTKIGVEIIREIFNLILKNSFGLTNQSMSASMASFVPEDDGDQN